MSREEEILRRVADCEMIGMRELSEPERAAAERLQALGLVFYDVAIVITQAGRNALRAN